MRDRIGRAIPQASGKSEDRAHTFHALRESEKPGPEIEDNRKRAMKGIRGDGCKLYFYFFLSRAIWFLINKNIKWFQLSPGCPNLNLNGVEV